MADPMTERAEIRTLASEMDARSYEVEQEVSGTPLERRYVRHDVHLLRRGAELLRGYARAQEEITARYENAQCVTCAAHLDAEPPPTGAQPEEAEEEIDPEELAKMRADFEAFVRNQNVPAAVRRMLLPWLQQAGAQETR